MNIALFTDTYLPDVNGVAVSVQTHKMALEQLGHKVYVVTTRSGLFKIGYDEDGTVIRVPGVRLKKLYGYNLAKFMSFRVAQRIKRLKIDVIHVHTEFSIGMFGRILSKRYGIPLIYTYHTMYEDYYHYISKSKLAKDFTIKASFLAANTASEIIVPSNKSREALRMYGVEKFINVIPTGLNLERFNQALDDDQRAQIIREEYNLQDKTVFIFLGRLAKEKSVDLVISGFKTIMERHPDAHLLIVGDGPSKEDCKKVAKDLAIEEHVTFTGKMPPEAVPYFYKAADVFVNASSSETQGLTYIEAMATGLPVIARYDANLEGVIDNGENGYFFSDEDDFARKVDTFLLLTKEQKDRMKNAAIAKTLQYNLEDFGKAIYEVYDRALERSKEKKKK